MSISKRVVQCQIEVVVSATEFGRTHDNRPILITIDPVVVPRRRFSHVLGDGRMNTMTTTNNLAGLLLRRGKLDESLKSSRQLVGAREGSPATDHYLTAMSHGG